MRSRLALAFLIAVAACLAFTASASACPSTILVLSPKTAGSGETVYYSIKGIVPGASYSFTVAGKEISGSNTSSSDNGVSGTFTMPDLGSQEQTLTADGTCSCPDGGDNPGLHDWMTYQVPSPVKAPATQPAVSPPNESPAAETETANVPKRHTHPRPLPSLALAKREAKKQRHDSPGTSPAVGAAPSDVVGSGLGPRQPRSGSGANDKSSRESSGVPSEVLDAVGGTTSVGPAKVPTLGLVAIGLILIAGLGLAGLAIRIFRNGPDPDSAIKDPAPLGPDPIEAELQQIIADEMARKLVSDLNLGGPTKVISK